MDGKYWNFPKNINLQFELVRWRRFLATETKSNQKDWVLAGSTETDKIANFYPQLKILKA